MRMAIFLPTIETRFNCFGTRSSGAKKIKRRQQNPRNSKIYALPPRQGGKVTLQDGASAWRRDFFRLTTWRTISSLQAAEGRGGAEGHSVPLHGVALSLQPLLQRPPGVQAAGAPGYEPAPGDTGRAGHRTLQVSIPRPLFRAYLCQYHCIKNLTEG